MFKEKVLNKEKGIITYGITPPKAKNTEEKIVEISQKQVERIKNLDIDALVIYDIQDEKERTDEERPFPFLETVDSILYANKYLKELDVEKITYRCVGKYTKDDINNWLDSNDSSLKYSVFVGAASHNQQVNLSLRQAYGLVKNRENLLLGGVTIPERHSIKHDEHLRVLSKIENGCNYFISQAVFNLEASKSFLSDYYYYCKENDLEMVPVLFTLTPCGSAKTLEFMKWLGISIPKWLENELLHSGDILEASIKEIIKIFAELVAFAGKKGIPIGCNIESVSTRKVEIEASIKLFEEIKKILGR